MTVINSHKTHLQPVLFSLFCRPDGLGKVKLLDPSSFFVAFRGWQNHLDPESHRGPAVLRVARAWILHTRSQAGREEDRIRCRHPVRCPGASVQSWVLVLCFCGVWSLVWPLHFWGTFPLCVNVHACGPWVCAEAKWGHLLSCSVAVCPSPPRHGVSQNLELAWEPAPEVLWASLNH